MTGEPECLHKYMYVCDLWGMPSNICKTLIGVHEMHGRMHPN